MSRVSPRYPAVFEQDHGATCTICSGDLPEFPPWFFEAVKDITRRLDEEMTARAAARKVGDEQGSGDEDKGRLSDYPEGWDKRVRQIVREELARSEAEPSAHRADAVTA